VVEGIVESSNCLHCTRANLDRVSFNKRNPFRARVVCSFRLKTRKNSPRLRLYDDVRKRVSFDRKLACSELNIRRTVRNIVVEFLRRFRFIRPYRRDVSDMFYIKNVRRCNLRVEKSTTFVRATSGDLREQSIRKINIRFYYGSIRRGL